MKTFVGTASKGLLVLAIVAGAIAMTGAVPHHSMQPRAVVPGTAGSVVPGIVIKIESAQIASDGTIQAKVMVTDPAGAPLDKDGVKSLGTLEIGFVAAVLPNGASQYTAYTTAPKTVNGVTAIQAAYDSGGVFQALNPGEYSYTFATKAPAGFDVTATHSIGAYAERDLTGYNLGFAGIDDVYTFVPNGTAVTHVRDIVREATCNNCHSVMSGHGGSRTKVLMCILCHTPQSVNPDTGNTVDFPTMIHKIHAGASLPSVQAGGKYDIIHHGSDNDFSTVVYPADTRRCRTCHDPNSGAVQANAYLTPSKTACGSCHDNINFVTGANHANTPATDDAHCVDCHKPTGAEFDLSVTGAHTMPTESKALPGVQVEILRVDNGLPGQMPTVTFKLVDGSGNGIPLAQMTVDPNAVHLILAGPASDYGYTSFGPDAQTGYVLEDPTTTGTCTPDGTCTYTFTHAIPAKATGTYTVGIEATRLATLAAGTPQQQDVEYGTPNKVFYFSVDGSPIQPRRTVVDTANCNNCHVALAAHGQNRNRVELCVMCHNPSLTDASTRATSKNPADLAQPPQAVNFNLMIHRIHTGVNLVPQGATYIEVSHGGRHVDFTGVRYPVQGPDGSVGDTTKCAMCHVGNSEQNLPLGLNQVTDPQGLLNPVGPITSACSGCHVTVDTASHALANTTKLGEGCTTCHGAGADFSVSKIHPDDVIVAIASPSAPVITAPASGVAGVSTAPVLTWNAAAGAESYDVYFGTLSTPPLVANTTATNYAPGTLSLGAVYYWRIVAMNSSGSKSSATWSFTTGGAAAVALQFIPVTPCRVADTRNAQGPFGQPAIAGGATRTFAIPQGGCGIPNTAQAYSLNVTAVPQGPLQYLTLWPAGQPQPGVSTLNSLDGIITANAAIVPAGTGGGVSVFVTNTADVVLDINGYFDLPGANSKSFYPVAPCRVADTRGATGSLGGPSLFAGQSRDFPVASSACLPAAASAYSLNVTALPDPILLHLSYLTTWPTGQPQPLVSTLNAPTGNVVANAAIVPSGTNGSISVFVSDPANLVLDIDGYFAAAGSPGALSFHPMTPCRVADTRNAAGPFGGPTLGAGATRSFAIPNSGCYVPTTAAAYSVNVTVVPRGSLGYITLWPAGGTQPLVSTLNSWDGSVVANAAIVPAGTGGAISVFASDQTDVIVDINGYFAP
jgi:OmcA/MtrC family decaheme c-type cytochrome